MPYRAWPQPFSSVNIPDDDWNDAAAQWRLAQGQYDTVAPPSPDKAELGPGFNPSNPDVTAALGQAEMPHADWQAARAQQIAARDADPTPAADAIGSPTPDPLPAFQKMLADPTEEGRRNKVYLDSRGFPTVGIGHLVQPADNLRVGEVIPDQRIDAFFQQDGAKALRKARDQAAQAGISDPDFINRLGAVNFQLADKWPGQFPKTWNMIRSGDYAGAADELYNSNWVKQTPRRVEAFRDALLRLPPKPAP